MGIPLEDQFHEAMLSVYARARDECGYTATRFLQMVNEHGGLEAAKRLLDREDLPEGFTALWNLERLDLTMEALILRPPWNELFTEEEREIARNRLSDAGYEGDEEV